MCRSLAKQSSSFVYVILNTKWACASVISRIHSFLRGTVSDTRADHLREGGRKDVRPIMWECTILGDGILYDVVLCWNQFCPFEKEANEGIKDLPSAIVFIKTTHRFFDGPFYKSVNSWNQGRSCSFRIQNYINKTSRLLFQRPVV